MGKLLDRFRDQGPSRPRSKADTEKRRRVLIVLLIVVAILAAGVTVGYGYYDTSIKPWRQPIVKVNGTVIRMRTFVKALRLNGVSDSSSAPYVATSLEEIELKRQGLDEFDVDVRDVCSDEAVEGKLREQLALYGFVSDNATDDEFEEGRKSFKEALRKQLELSLGDYKKLAIEPELISDELRERIGNRDYSATDNFTHAQVQALLIKGSDNATLMRARWENGEAFDTLSADSAVSSYLRDLASDNATANWVAKGVKSDAFDDYAFRAAPGVLSDPIQDTDDTTTYWLIKVTGTQERPLTDSDRTTLVAEAYDEWLAEAKDSGENKIVYYLDLKGGPAKLTWAVAHVAVSTD